MFALVVAAGLFFVVLFLLILWIAGLTVIALHPRFRRPRTNLNPAVVPATTTTTTARTSTNAKPSGTPAVDNIELAHRQQLTGRILKTSTIIAVDYGGFIEDETETSPSSVTTTTNDELVADFGDGDDGNNLFSWRNLPAPFAWSTTSTGIAFSATTRHSTTTTTAATTFFTSLASRTG